MIQESGVNDEPKEWPERTHLKIHEGCGGRVDWVPHPSPAIGFTGDCNACRSGRLPIEEIIPVELPDGVTADELHQEMDTDAIKAWEWSDDLFYEDGQEEIRDRFIPETYQR